MHRGPHNAQIGVRQARDRRAPFPDLRQLRGPVTFPLAEPGWLPVLAVDGKAVRSAAGPDGKVPYLLAATHGTAPPASLT